MPIYEYRCGKCGKAFEKLVLAAGEAGRAACPKCGARSARRILSRFSTKGRSESEDWDGGSAGDPGEGGGAGMDEGPGGGGLDDDF